MAFVSMALDLASQDRSTQGVLQLGACVHAAVMSLISSVDTVLGRELHDCQRQKPLSLAIYGAHPSQINLRVAFMGGRGMQAADALIMAIARSPDVQLGRSQWQVVGVDCSNGTWGATCTWADLTAPCRGNRIEFDFVTPTAFTKSDGCGNRFVSVLPEPVDVFNCLVNRWNGLGGPHLPSSLIEYIDSGGCVVSDINIRCVTSQLRERVQKGVTGRVTYELSERDPACASAMHQLARLAFFSGVGYQTARGMGAVKTRSW